MVLVKTAYSSHKKCLICGQRTNLRQIKLDSIVYAWSKHKILIKHHDRTCCRHIDSNGLILHDWFTRIRTREINYGIETIRRMDFLSSSSSCMILEKFKNIDTLTDEHCLKITGWKKEEFKKFSKYITTINSTSGRTKDELIALYRYWLLNGLNQKIIALFKNCSQQDVSRYLNQIRVAINNEFVPFFLGANRSRKFYLNHTSQLVKSLYVLRKKDLAVVADGTYCRCEKSNNNNFQYNTYSGQKKDSLIKPFLICTTDGYIIDLYGPFAANKNDSSILDSILNTDTNIRRILKPEYSLMFLDRGYIVKIIYCFSSMFIQDIFFKF